MFRSLCKNGSSLLELRLRLLQPYCNKTPATTKNLLYLLHLQSFSTAAPTTRNSQSPISSTDYLVSSLGLSPESALKIPKNRQINLKSTTNADSVVAFFKDYGFSLSQTAKMFSLCPELLSYDLHKYLKPKLDFFVQNGISGDTLAHILTNDPFMFRLSLHEKIIPCFNFLKTFFNGSTQGSIVSLFLQKRGTWVLRCYSETSAAANVETLRRYGVPDSNIVRLLVTRPQILSRDTEELDDCLREVREMGFDPSSLMFIYGVRGFYVSRKDRWVSKMEVFKKSFGWTDQQVLPLFVKQPTITSLSEERLKESLDVLTKRLHWTGGDIAKYPRLLHCSIDKKILPRFSVLETLMSNGLLKKSCWRHAYVMTEDAFLRRFVHKYQEEIPQLLEIYQKNMGRRELVAQHAS